MTNFRRRQAGTAPRNQEATSLNATRARAILDNEDAPVRDALAAGGLLHFSIKEVLG